MGITVSRAESWRFLTSDTNDPYSSETVALIGWFQVCTQRIHTRRLDLKARKLLSKTKEKKQEGLYRRATPSGKIGAQ
jgi:hypothetical protein